ncbi:hypothetical protein LWI28_023837 [Acer negundo]|uniref:Protein kinase domain-containing protein n=1 Tax=Acer negundo TaxID=4023 RepID=A0AAD5IK83_ACENE|nr:hypothetical protein LWI28_023837 [Acer negundo]
MKKDEVKKQGLMEQIEREISVMRLARYPNIIELKEGMATRTKIFFVIEYVKGGELFPKIIAKGRLKEDLASKLSALPEQLWNDGLLHTQCGTPEVLSKRGYDGAKSDIWSCGIVLFVLLSGYLPFQHENVMKMYRKIFQGRVCVSSMDLNGCQEVDI